jgi:hypothetical protein
MKIRVIYGADVIIDICRVSGVEKAAREQRVSRATWGGPVMNIVCTLLPKENT